MLSNEAIKEIQKDKKIRYYFRYALHDKDFKKIEADEGFWGYYAAKPLYGSLKPDGSVNRYAGYNGKLAVLFIPSGNSLLVKLLLTEIPKELVLLPGGKRNWEEIRRASEEAIKIYGR